MFLGVSLGARSQTCFFKLPPDNNSLFLLTDHQTIPASEKKESITYSYSHILKTFKKIAVKYLQYISYLLYKQDFKPAAVLI